MERNYFLAARTESGLPRLITVAEITNEERQQFPYVLLIDLPYRALDNELPARGELDRVVAIEEKLIATLGKDVLHLGHITFQGKMKVAFASSQEVPPSLTVKTGFLKKQTYTVEARKDPSWAWFEYNMQLTPLEIEAARLRQIIQALTSHGDVPSKAREVEFFSYFPSRELAEKFVESVKPEGFQLEPSGIHCGDHEKRPYSAVLLKTTTVESDTLANTYVYLRKQAAEFDGEFDGCGCNVVL